MSKLHFDNPAGHMREALAIGNGRTGAMVFGRVAQERLQLSAFSLSAGAVCALGDLLLDFIGLTAPASYRRWLDPDTSVASTRMHIGVVWHEREAFVSAPDQVAVLRLAVDTGAMDFDLGYRHPAKAHEIACFAQPPVARWDRQETLNREQRPPTLSIRPDGDGALLVAGRNSGARYAVRIRAFGDGAVSPGDDRIRIRGATRMTLLIATATSPDDAVGAVRARTEAAARKSYAGIKADHVAAVSTGSASFRLQDKQSRKERPCSQATPLPELPAYRS